MVNIIEKIIQCWWENHNLDSDSIDPWYTAKVVVKEIYLITNGVHSYNKGSTCKTIL